MLQEVVPMLQPLAAIAILSCVMVYLFLMHTAYARRQQMPAYGEHGPAY